MNTSLFLELVEKYFRLVVGKITEKFNGSNTESTMLHKTMLTEEYSADLTWGSTELNHSVVAADVVSLDSSLPLKSRGSLSQASGKLPKLGVKFRKGEKDISDINVIKAKGVDESQVVAKIFEDLPKCVKSMDVRKEIMFEQALSTGMTLVSDDTNTGTGIRVSFGYKTGNTFYAQTAFWGEDGFTPIEDIRQMFDKARDDSNTIGLVLISKTYMNLLRASVYAKKLSADFRGQIYTSPDYLAQPSRQAMIEALEDEFGATFRVVDSSFKIENKDGSKTAIKPWAEANIVGVPEQVVGRLVYGTLAEETNPVPAVTYQKSGSHVLLSKYSKNDPLEEFTAAQAICLPVIDGVDGIYLLKADGTAALSVNKSKVEFTAAADSTGIVVKVHSESAYTVAQTASTSWLTPTKNTDGSTINLTVAANESAKRTSTVTLTDADSNTVTITVTQAAGS